MTPGPATFRSSYPTGPTPGPDPWCTWCDDDLDPDAELYQIEGRQDSRWPPTFCSADCAHNWGCAADEDCVVAVEGVLD